MIIKQTMVIKHTICTDMKLLNRHMIAKQATTHIRTQLFYKFSSIIP